MALVPQTLSNGIAALLTDLSTRMDDQPGAIQDLADQLTTLIDTYILYKECHDCGKHHRDG